MVLLPALVSLAIVAAGRAWRQSHAIPLALAVAAGTVVAVLVFGGRESDVTTARAVEGAVVAGTSAAVALAAYYMLGRLVRHPVALGAAWLFSLVPLYLGGFLVLIWTADLTQCTPDDYECPL